MVSGNAVCNAYLVEHFGVAADGHGPVAVRSAGSGELQQGLVEHYTHIK